MVEFSFKVQLITPKVLIIPRQKNSRVPDKNRIPKSLLTDFESAGQTSFPFSNIIRQVRGTEKQKPEVVRRGGEGQVEALDLDPVTWIESALVWRASWLGYLVAGCRSSLYSLVLSQYRTYHSVPDTFHTPNTYLAIYYVSK